MSFPKPYIYFLFGMTQKECEEGASHTVLTVRFITYKHHSHIRSYQIFHYSAALLMHFDRRWLISFMAFVLMTKTYKRLLKLKWKDYKNWSGWFLIVVQILIGYDILEQTQFCLLLWCRVSPISFLFLIQKFLLHSVVAHEWYLEDGSTHVWLL